MAPPVVTSSLNPLLGLPSPFPFLSAHGLTSLSDPKAAKTPALPPGLPPGFPGMIYYKKKFSLFHLGENCLFTVELNVEYDWHVTDTPKSKFHKNT